MKEIRQLRMPIGNSGQGENIMLLKHLAAEVSMLSKKYAIKNLSYLVLMWFILAFGHGIAALAFIIILIQTEGLRSFSGFHDYIFVGTIYSIYFPVLFLWRKSTFRRADIIKLAKGLGVKFTNTIYYYSPLDIIGVYSFARGFLDNINVVAKMDLPFFAYAPFKRISGIKNGRFVMSGGDGPEYMKQESRIELFSLISGPFDIDVTIKIEDRKRNIPATGSAEIDGIISNALKDVEYFHARLMINKECLRMTLIGGSWEGRRFGEKILKGFEIFQKLNHELKVKYPVGDWKDWQVKWNKKEEEFYLEAKGRAK